MGFVEVMHCMLTELCFWKIILCDDWILYTKIKGWDENKGGDGGGGVNP